MAVNTGSIFGDLSKYFTNTYWNNKASNSEIVDVNSCNNAWYKVGFNALSNIAGFTSFTNGITCDDLPQTRVNLIDNREKGQAAIALVSLIIVLTVAIIIVSRSK